MSPKYASLSSQSSAALPLPPDHDLTLAELSEEERGRADEDGEAGETDDEAAGREGLLSGLPKEEEPELVLIHGRSKHWLGYIRLRTALLLSLSVLSLVLLFVLFHPRSPLPHFYGSSTLTPGTFSPSGAIVPNPLPSGAKFGDVPFASLGASLAEETPGWAGGDDGAAKLEGGGGNGARWNGTHWWDRTVLLVSLDGLRADYLTKGLTPNLVGVSKRGLKAEYLKPVFPSLTFPNHYSIITGLYPASHGIVANDFWDPATGKEFVYIDPTKSWSGEWWGGEPIWSTAIKNGLRSVVMMWPGPPVMADGTKPTQWYPFENKYHYSKKVAKIASWLDQPRATRPHLITAYAPEVDQEGHRSGPYSGGVEQTLKDMDLFAKDLVAVLEARNLTDVVDVIFVSDHGMTDTHNERLVFLDDILGREGFEGIESNEGWPSAGLRFQPHIDSADMLSRLQNASEQANGGFHVYTHATMPERWHFGGHERIAPIYVVPHVGWAVSNRHDFHVTMKGDYHPKGNHGYDNDDPSMHAIFIAHGPLASTIKSASASRLRRRQEPAAPPPTDGITVIPGFANLEVYNLVAGLLGIGEAGRAGNNGTVGFWEGLLEF